MAAEIFLSKRGAPIRQKGGNMWSAGSFHFDYSQENGPNGWATLQNVNLTNLSLLAVFYFSFYRAARHTRC